MDIVLLIIFTLAGLAVGSFLNVCIDRLPARKSLVSPPSHCDACGRPLSPLDLVPVFSYLWLRGRCRYCGAGIPLRSLLVEVLTGALFLIAFWRYGSSAEFALTAFWSCVFLVIIFIDWEQQLILNRVTYPAAVVALVIYAADSMWPDLGLSGNLTFWFQPSILSAVIGGFIGFFFFFIVILINQKGLGMGDVKLAALIGLVTGLPSMIFALLCGVIVGGIVAIILLAFKKKGRKDVIPYGTFLAIGPIITLLMGKENIILNWYLGLYQ